MFLYEELLATAAGRHKKETLKLSSSSSCIDSCGVLKWSQIQGNYPSWSHDDHEDRPEPRKHPLKVKRRGRKRA